LHRWGEIDSSTLNFTANTDYKAQISTLVTTC